MCSLPVLYCTNHCCAALSCTTTPVLYCQWKAFDTVDHNIRLRKLDYYGIRGIANEWFCFYLKKRKQFVSIQNNMSSIKEILAGVPQGSVLGPLLCLIYIKDLHKSIRFSKTCHFADDTSIIQSNPLLDRLSKQVYKQKLIKHLKSVKKSK